MQHLLMHVVPLSLHSPACGHPDSVDGARTCCSLQMYVLCRQRCGRHAMLQALAASLCRHDSDHGRRGIQPPHIRDLVGFAPLLSLCLLAPSSNDASTYWLAQCCTPRRCSSIVLMATGGRSLIWRCTRWPSQWCMSWTPTSACTEAADSCRCTVPRTSQTRYCSSSPLSSMAGASWRRPGRVWDNTVRWRLLGYQVQRIVTT